MIKKDIEKMFYDIAETLGIEASLEFDDLGNPMGLASKKQKKVWLSIFIFLKKELDIKYIIIHELAHIKTWTPNNFHGKLFKTTEKRFLEKFGIVAKYKDNDEYPYAVEYQ